MDHKPSDRSTRVRAAMLPEALLQCWEELFEEEDRKLALTLRRLLLKLYIYHQEGKKMYKMDAGKFMPLDHAASTRKYLDLAKTKRWLKFTKERSDQRKKVIELSQSLLTMIDHYADQLGAKAAELYTSGKEKTKGSKRAAAE
jgi:hypothetical protein